MQDKLSVRKLFDPRRWWFMSTIVWHIFDEQETMFGDYGRIVIRVPFDVAFRLAFYF